MQYLFSSHPARLHYKVFFKKDLGCSGSIDFIGLNVYYGQVVAAGERPQRGSLLVDSAVRVLTNRFGAEQAVWEAFSKVSIRTTSSAKLLSTNAC